MQMDSFGARFGALVRKYREARGLSSGELAESALGDAAKRSRISEIENGKVKRPHAKTIDALVLYLNIPHTEVDACRKPVVENYGLPRELLENIATRFGVENPDASEAELVAYLKQTAKDWIGLKERMAVLEVLDSNLSNLLGEAARLMDVGDFDGADDRLADAEELQITERALQEVVKATEIASTRAGAALLGGHETRAAAHITRAAGFIAGLDADAAAYMRRDFAIRLCNRAQSFGGIGFGEAVKLYEMNLAHWRLDTYATNWSMTQNDLALALGNQGARMEGAAGSDLLARAVTAYEAALQVRTREDAPQDWAMMQNNLAVALGHQAERVEGAAGSDLLARAVAAYEAALQVRTREDVPLDWAMTQNNLAYALSNQAARVEGAAGSDLLARAVTAYEAALQVRTREDAPQDWAMMQNNLAVALNDQAAREKGAAGFDLLARAVEVFEEALHVSTREDAPQLWAAIHENLGRAFQFSATRSDNPKQDLTTALIHFDTALEVYDPIYTSYLHSICNAMRDEVLAALAELDKTP